MTDMIALRMDQSPAASTPGDRLLRSRGMAVLLRVVIFAMTLALVGSNAMAGERWTSQKANDWYAKQPWMVGANYLPRSAINQLEMFQADTFDPKVIDQEFGWAAELGFNVMRIFLHDLLWAEDADGFCDRFDQVLAIAQKHHIRVIATLFDSCWNPLPKLGPQPVPRPRTHNSGWVQSPGRDILADESKWDALKSYVVGIICRYKEDPRIVIWDLYNELDNMYGPPPYRSLELPDKKERSLALARQVIAWARSVHPSQPLTISIWQNHTAPLQIMAPWQQFQIEESDVISFHIYANIDATRQAVEALQKYGRPLICTEYMARQTGSTFDTILPYFKAQKVAAINWGFVDGKSQTKFPWDSWEKPYPDDPELWFHDILRADGRAYRADEVQLIRKLTDAAAASSPVPKQKSEKLEAETIEVP
jgi:Cellulase (glycosyl hydrolase family 5)